MPHQRLTRTWVQTYTSGYANIMLHAHPRPSSDGRARSSRCCAARSCWHHLTPLCTCVLPYARHAVCFTASRTCATRLPRADKRRKRPAQTVEQTRVQRAALWQHGTSLALASRRASSESPSAAEPCAYNKRASKRERERRQRHSRCGRGGHRDSHAAIMDAWAAALRTAHGPAGSDAAGPQLAARWSIVAAQASRVGSRGRRRHCLAANSVGEDAAGIGRGWKQDRAEGRPSRRPRAPGGGVR